MTPTRAARARAPKRRDLIREDLAWKGITATTPEESHHWGRLFDAAGENGDG